LSGPVVFEENDALLVASAAMVVSGYYVDLKRLLDAVEETEYLRISQAAFSFNDGNTEWLDRINLRFEVLMIRHNEESAE